LLEDGLSLSHHDTSLLAQTIFMHGTQGMSKQTASFQLSSPAPYASSSSSPISQTLEMERKSNRGTEDRERGGRAAKVSLQTRDDGAFAAGEKDSLGVEAGVLVEVADERFDPLESVLFKGVIAK
jgi:hypothetical protein